MIYHVHQDELRMQNLLQEALRKSSAPVHVKYLQTLVECLCMLGKVAAAGAIIWYAVTFDT